MDPKLKERILGLSGAQLGEVRKLVSMLASQGGKIVIEKATPTDDLDMTILDVICEVLRAHGGGSPGMAALKKSNGYKTFKNKLEAHGIDKFLLGAVKKNRVKLRALVHLSVDLLFENMTKIGGPVSSITMMAQIHRLPAILNASFPGYSESGLLGMIIQPERKNVRKKSDSRA